MVSSVRALILLLASLCPALGQPVPPKPLAVYILEIETDVKGDFSKAAGELTSALETAFTHRHAFKILERGNLSLIVRQNQLEKDLHAVSKGSLSYPCGSSGTCKGPMALSTAIS
jgi:hypothetical protein